MIKGQIPGKGGDRYVPYEKRTGDRLNANQEDNNVES